MLIELNNQEKFYLDKLLMMQEEITCDQIDLVYSQERRSKPIDLCGQDDCCQICPKLSGIHNSLKAIRSIRVKLNTVEEGDPYGIIYYYN